MDRPVFNKLLPKQVKPTKTTVPKKKYMPGEKIFFQMHKDNKTFWEQGIIKNKIGHMVYMVEGPHATHKKHLNQIRKCTSDKSSETLPKEEEMLDLLYDAFDLEPPQTRTEIRRSGRKRKLTDSLEVNSRKKNYRDISGK